MGFLGEFAVCQCVGGLLGALDLRTLALTSLNHSSSAGVVDFRREIHFYPELGSGFLFAQKVGASAPVSPEVAQVRASLRALSGIDYAGLYARGSAMREVARAVSGLSGTGAQERATGALVRILDRVRAFRRPEAVLGGPGLRGCLGGRFA